VAGQGAHFLRPRLAADIVRRSGVGPGDLVLDLGAGLGALTAPLAATGARVVAVEKQPSYARGLARRLGHTVTVVEGDLLTVPLPRRDFRVVANIPFGTTTALLRRLLDPGASRLVRADVVVQYGVARKLTGVPGDARTRWWTARYRIRLVRRIPAACFQPPPSVDAALLVVERPDLPPRAERLLADLLAGATRAPERSARSLVRGLAGPAALTAAGIDPGRPAGLVPPAGWRVLAAAVVR
jgi:23S rRNA (adenine-N6)-dimethyltransferase